MNCAKVAFQLQQQSPSEAPRVGAALLALTLAALVQTQADRPPLHVSQLVSQLVTRSTEAAAARQGARRRVIASGLGAAHAAGRCAVEALLHDQVERRQLAALRRARARCSSAARLCLLHAAARAVRDGAAQAQQWSTAPPRQYSSSNTHLPIGACTSALQGGQLRYRNASR